MLQTLIDKKKLYSLKQAIKLIKTTSNTRFAASVDTHFNLVSAGKKAAAISGSVRLPFGTGKKTVVAVADDKIIDQIASGKIKFDILVAHPSFMPKLAKYARILGPKGLMPNPKKGTISQTPEKRAQELEAGETAWKTEPNNPLVHQTIGKVSFTEKQLEENILALIKSIGLSKIAKLTLSSTMGPGIKVDLVN